MTCNVTLINTSRHCYTVADLQDIRYRRGCARYFVFASSLSWLFPLSSSRYPTTTNTTLRGATASTKAVMIHRSSPLEACQASPSSSCTLRQATPHSEEVDRYPGLTTRRKMIPPAIARLCECPRRRAKRQKSASPTYYQRHLLLPAGN